MSKDEAHAAKKAAKKLAKAKAKAEGKETVDPKSEEAPAPAPAQDAALNIASTSEVSSSKKDKKKKRKMEEVEGVEEREEEGKKAKSELVETAVLAETAGESSTAGEKSSKKDKKDKKDKKKKSKDVGPIEVPAEKHEIDAEGDTAMLEFGSAPMSKKEAKKLEKAKRKAAAPITDISSTSTGANNDDATLSTAASSSTQAETTAFLSKHAITVDPTGKFPTFQSLSSLPITPALRPFIEKFDKPTPIQATSWPPLFAGHDVVGIAETGSGKTLAFGLPGLQLLSMPANKPNISNKGKRPTGSAHGQIQILVVAPTRELATQTFDTLKALGELVGIGAVCLYGGVGKDEQLGLLRDKGTRIVVGTPGRILDLANNGDVEFSGVKYLVLDEADRMLDQGFENDIRKIIGYCPSKEDGRQTVMFSATWPESVRRLASTFLSLPVKITVGSDELTANKRIEQVVEVLDNPRDKERRLENHLRAFMKSHPKSATYPARVLVFALYKKEATRIELTLRHAGFSVAGLHGDLGQEARFKALDAFKTGKVNVLVATDVAARGLDIPDVGLVINVTFPLTTEDFVHRCGRTGRAGKTGKAITYFTGENHERSLAGEFMRVLRDAGAEIPKEMDRFPSTIKKKEHGVYGAFYKDMSDAPAPKKIVFD